MRRAAIRCGLAAALAIPAAAARAQTAAFPGIDAASAAAGGERSLLGPAPGEAGAPDEATSPQGALIPSRVGPNAPRVPTSITAPGTQASPARAPRTIGAPARPKIAEVPPFGTLALPAGPEDPGPADGLTLDAAIELLLRNNLDLRARRFELPQAEADVLTAGLRANPILYTDSQLIPYGSFSKNRPGGPNQFDLNVSYPLDLSGKRRARTVVAARAKCVQEAQFQDAVRLQIDALGSAFVDVLAAAESLRYARASVAGLDELLAVTTRSQARGNASRDDVDRIEIQRDSAAIGAADAEEALRRARRALALMLNLPPGRHEGLTVRGSVRDDAPPPPPTPELVRLALAYRPDLNAYRLGVRRAEADVTLARANRFQDVYLQYQPYTFQNNTPFDAKSAHSWALGVAVPLPIANRNQGNIRRAELNVGQTQVELAALEQRVVAEVEQAARDYAATRAVVDRLERNLLPRSARVRDNTQRLLGRGGAEVVAFLNARREYNDLVREYFDFVVRHRRQMLALDTAVGLRILP